MESICAILSITFLNAFVYFGTKNCIIPEKQEFKLTLNIKSCKRQEIKALDVHQFIYSLIHTSLWFLHGLR